MRRIIGIPLCFLFLLPSTFAEGDPTTADATVHNELRAIRATVVKAVADGELDKIIAHLHPNVVVSWPDGTVSRRHQGVRNRYEELMTGDSKIIDSLTTELDADELSIIYGGDTVIAWGTSVDTYNMTNGDTLILQGRWSATLIKEEGRWLIASFNGISNVFDNAILSATKAWIWKGALAALILGLFAGWLVTRKSSTS